MKISNFGNSEVIQVAEAVAREKSIPKEKILEALEDAIKIAARRKYGYEHEIKASIDRRTGEIRLYRELLVVADDVTEEEHVANSITLTEAKFKKPDIQAGEKLQEPLPPLDLARLAAQSAKQVIITKIKEIERTQQYEEFKNRVGEVVNGLVDKIEFNRVIVKIGNAEAVLKKEHMLKADYYKQSDRIKAYLLELDQNNRGPQIVLSRTANQFIAKLFAQEVPEIYENIIQIKAVARDPGSRAKIAVFSSDSSIDPIGSCVGMRGARVQAVTAELKGEKIDILEWSPDPATLAIRALSPAAAIKVIVDEERKKLEVVVPDDQQSIAIGRQGQNVRLASELTGWRIDILTEANETKRRQEEFSHVTEHFMRSLDLEEILAQLLASEGFISVNEIAEATVSELTDMQGLNEDIALELINRAQAYMENPPLLNTQPGEVPVAEKGRSNKGLLAITEISPELAAQLCDKGVKGMVDLADLSRDEFLELIPDSGLDLQMIDEIIMSARRRTYLKAE